MARATPATAQIRFAVAYTTKDGLDLLLPRLQRSVGARRWDAIPKTLVTSFDYGHTTPEALDHWLRLPGTGRVQVFVANAALVRGGHLRPTAAFHPKLYLFDTGVTARSAVVGSANLTQRAMTVNTECVMATDLPDGAPADTLWTALAGPCAPLTRDLLDAYAALRARERVTDEDVPPPPAAIAPRGRPVLFEAIADGRVNPMAFDRFWVEAGRMSSGGSASQLELPRGANRFFGYRFADYDEADVTPIGPVDLEAGTGRWPDQRLRWHGDNAMERLNMPTLARGGFNYRDTAVMFRRAGGRFLLEVTPWNSALAVSWRNASAARGTLFRLGTRTPRICGFV